MSYNANEASDLDFHLVEVTQDPELVFTLKANNRLTAVAFENLYNERFYVSPPHHSVVSAESQVSLATTKLGDDNNVENGNDGEHSSHQLRFTFDQKPKNIQDGWVFGSNPKTCDVVIGTSKRGISKSHFRITFDDQGRLVLIDSSTNGTAVSYGHQARTEIRKNLGDQRKKRPQDKLDDFTWILLPELGEIKVVIGQGNVGSRNAHVIELSAEVADSESREKQYRKLKDAYLDEMQKAIAFNLNIDTDQTTTGQSESYSPKRPSEQRPKQRPIWINRKKIGNGKFGIVHQVVDVSTGAIYAAKTSLPNDEHGRRMWDTEVALLRRVSHDHIVKFVDYEARPEYPRLIMEYLHHGNLAEQDKISPITEWETVTILYQALDALDYLHSQDIVHRDLKPENILVQCRETANFCIKIADFGLAGDDSFLQTFCGTYVYAAPEIWEHRPYTAKVDIWSLGVIAFRYTNGLPPVPQVNGRFYPECWFQDLLLLNDAPDSSELVCFITSSMLRMNPEERLSASACLSEAARLRETIVPAQNVELDLGSPTEPMTHSSIMRGFLANRYEGGQNSDIDPGTRAESMSSSSTIKASLATGYESASSVMTAYRATGYEGGQQMAAEEVETQIDFPTLRTSRHHDST